MTPPSDACRLYLHLRNKACADAEPGTRSEESSAIVSFASDHGEGQEVGLDRAQALEAIEQLCETELVQRLTTQEQQEWMREHPGPHDLLLRVGFCDDLTAATVVLGGV